MPNDSVFKAVTPEQLEGPFSSFLQPTQSQQQASQQGPPVMASKATSLGYIAQKFIEGASEGRIKKFEKQENEKIQKLQTFQGYVSQIYQNRNLTDDAKQLALNKYSQVMGGYGRDAAGKGGGKGKKGSDEYPSKGGKPLERGTASGGGGGVYQHFTNIARDVFQGMTGGKMPKGAPDVGGAMAEVHAAIFDENGQPKPQFSVQGIVAQNQQDIARKLKDLGPDATQEDAMRAIMPHLQALDRHAPQVGAQARNDLAGQYQPAPKYGTDEYNRREWAKMHQPPGQPPAGGPPNAGVDPNTPANVRGIGTSPGPPPAPPAGAAPQQGPPAAPQGHVFSPTEWGLIQTAGWANKPQAVEYTGPDGKQVRSVGQLVNTPNGQSGWYDVSGREIAAKDVRLASTAEPKAERFTTAQTVKGDPKRIPGTVAGKWYKVEQSQDDPAKFHIIGETNNPQRPVAAFNPEAHPQVAIAKRKLAALEGLNKVMEQTTVPKNSKGEELSGQELAAYYWGNIQKYYGKDKAVSQYLPDIKAELDKMAKSETFKGKADALKVLQDATGQAKTEHKEARGSAQLDHIQQQHDELVNEMFGGSGQGGAAPTLEEFDR